MLKKDLLDIVAERAGVPTATAETVVREALLVIGEQLGRGEEVRLAGFGTFGRRTRAARTGRHPRTGEEMQIEASVSVGFKPAAQLKRTVHA